MPRIAFLLLVICLIHSSPSISAEIQLIRFSEDPWPPYTYGDVGSAARGGLAVEIVDEIFARIGVETEQILFPWKRCLFHMQTGERDALMLCGYSKEREKYLIYTESVMEVRDLLYYSKNRPAPVEWEIYADLAGYTFIRSAGFQYGKEFEEAVDRHNITIIESGNDLASFRMLAAGRGDAFICNEISAAEIFKNNEDLRGQFNTASNTVMQGPLFLAFSRKSPANSLVPRVNKTINEMKEDGTVDSILDRYR